MINFLAIAALSVLSAQTVQSQTRITFTGITATQGEQVVEGPNAAIQLRGVQGSGNVMLVDAGGISAQVAATVKAHSTLRTSLKNSAVSVNMKLNVKAEGQRATTQVEKIFYLDQERSASITKTFHFRQGITSRPVTLSYTVTIE